MRKQFALIAALYGLSGVVLGAYGAHGVSAWGEPSRLEIWRTAVDYQLIHALALLGLAALPLWPSALARAAGWCLAAGVLAFSGSLYCRAGFDYSWIGMVAPIGGLLLISGWLLLLAAVWRWSD